MFKLLHRTVNKHVYARSVLAARSNTHSRPVNFTKTQKVNEKPVEVVKWILLVIPVGSFVLGVWQVKRLQWKVDLIHRMKEKTTAAPVDIPEDLTKLESMEFSPVKVRGRFIHEKEFLIGPRALIENDSISSKVGSLVSDPKKNQGWLIITPFVLSDTGKVILINRGWVHQSLKPRDRRAASLVDGEVELTGVVRLSETRPPFMPKNNPEKAQWFTRDLYAMSDALGCSPVWLDARGAPNPSPGWPIPNQTRVTLRNEHLSYIVTWFSISGLTALMWYRLVIKKLPLL